MAYKVLKRFKDKKTGKIYEVGDKYPANAAKTRLAELTSDKNNLKKPIIEKTDK